MEGAKRGISELLWFCRGDGVVRVVIAVSLPVPQSKSAIALSIQSCFELGGMLQMWQRGLSL